MNKPEFVGQRTKSPYKAKYGNFIGGQWTDAVERSSTRRTRPAGRRRHLLLKRQMAWRGRTP